MATIQIPQALGPPVPGFEIMLNLAAKGGVPDGKLGVQLAGEIVAAGTMAANTVEPDVATASDAKTLAGDRSVLAWMAAIYFAHNNSKRGRPKGNVALVGLAEVGTGTAATAILANFETGDATSAGVHILNVGGHLYRVNVATGDTREDQANALVDVWNDAIDERRLPFTAAAAVIAADDWKVTITATGKTEALNGMVTKLEQDGDVGTDIAVPAAETAGGIGAHTTLLTSAKAALSAFRTQQLTPSFNDDASVEELIDHINAKSDASKMLGSRVVIAFEDTSSNMAAAAVALDSDDAERANAFGIYNSDTHFIQMACDYAAARASSDHLARSRNGMPLPGIKAPAVADVPSHPTLETLLEAGVAAGTVRDGETFVRLVRDVCLRTEFGVLDSQIIDTADFVRDALLIAFREADLDMASIVADSEPVNAEHITKPMAVKALIRGVFDDAEKAGYLTEVESLFESVVVNYPGGSLLQLLVPEKMVPILHNLQVRTDVEVP